MTLEMAHLQIVGLKTHLLPTLGTLRRLGCMHVDKVSESPETLLPPLTVDPVLARTKEELNMGLLQVKGLLDSLDINERELPHQEIEGSVEDWVTSVAALTPRVQALIARRDKLRAEQELLPRFEETVRRLLPILPAAALRPNYISFGLFVSRMHTEVLGIVQRYVVELTQGRAETATCAIDDSTQAMMIAAPAEFADDISALLDQHDVSRLRLPPEVDSASPDVALASLHSRLNAIRGEVADIERQLKQITDEWAPKLCLWRDFLADELDTYEVLSQMGETEMTFTILGWVPINEVDRLKTALSQEVGEEILVSELPLTREAKERAPVALTNPPPARPFEILVSLYAIPRYGGIDPTCLMALFMPIFFGMMLGDAGYGVLLLAAALFLRSRFKTGAQRSLTTILAIGAGWSIVFGMFYGEVFGTLGEKLGLHPLLFDRAGPEHLFDLLTLTVAIGAAHILLGLVLGVWEGIKEKNKHHLLERGGRLVGLIAMFLLVGVLLDYLPEGFVTPAIAVLVIGVVLLAVPYGKIGIIVAPIEMIGVVGNILSYVRIAAIGLASVYLALVANRFAGAIGNIVVGLIIAVLLHALNLALGTLSPSIQSLRLHYYEFFHNFYVGGGRLYKPFRSSSPVRHE